MFQFYEPEKNLFDDEIKKKKMKKEANEIGTFYF